MLFGCAAASAPPPKAAPESTPRSAPLRVFPELTADERILAEQLKVDVEHLSKTIGERHADSAWQLSDAADYIASSLEEMGLSVERTGYASGDVAAQNLSATIQGGMRGDEVLVIGAHYDSPVGSSGANAGASGTAAVLALARLMKGARIERALRFVFFAMGESPHGDGEGRGARHVARTILEEVKKGPVDEATGLPLAREVIIGMLHLDQLGALSPAASPGDEPITVEVLRTPGADKLDSSVVEFLRDDPVEVEQKKLSVEAGDSDVVAFHESGIPVVSVSGPKGENGSVEYGSLARVVMRLRRGIGQVAVESPTNDGMLTPLGDNLR